VTGFKKDYPYSFVITTARINGYTEIEAILGKNFLNGYTK